MSSPFRQPLEASKINIITRANKKQGISQFIRVTGLSSLKLIRTLLRTRICLQVPSHWIIRRPLTMLRGEGNSKSTAHLPKSHTWSVARPNLSEGRGKASFPHWVEINKPIWLIKGRQLNRTDHWVADRDPFSTMPPWLKRSKSLAEKCRWLESRLQVNWGQLLLSINRNSLKWDNQKMTNYAMLSRLTSLRDLEAQEMLTLSSSTISSNTQGLTNSWKIL